MTRKIGRLINESAFVSLNYVTWPIRNIVQNPQYIWRERETERDETKIPRNYHKYKFHISHKFSITCLRVHIRTRSNRCTHTHTYTQLFPLRCLHTHWRIQTKKGTEMYINTPTDTDAYSDTYTHRPPSHTLTNLHKHEHTDTYIHRPPSHTLTKLRRCIHTCTHWHIHT